MFHEHMLRGEWWRSATVDRRRAPYLIITTIIDIEIDSYIRYNIYDLVWMDA